MIIPFLIAGGDIQALLTAIVLAGAAFGVVWKWVLIPIHRAAKTIDRAAEASPTLLAISDQFKPNHGTSLRDVIDRIEAQQTRQDVRLDRQDEQLETIENKIDSFLRDRRPGGQRAADAE